jgi:WS/DGAT/MGAT family acyltransferase
LAELGPLYESPLDVNRPLWEAYVADGLADGRGAVFLKVHHSMIDAAESTRLLESLLGARRPSVAARKEGAPRLRPVGSVQLLDRALRDGIGEVFDLGGSIARAAGHALWNPGRTAASVLSGLRAGRSLARELLSTRAENPPGVSRSLSRRLAVFEMRRSEVDRVRERLGATVNEVLLAVVSGALHRWCQVEGLEVDDLGALVPFDPREGDGGAGSRMTPVSIPLPVGEPRMLRRLRVIQERMDRAKSDRPQTLYPWFARAVLAMPLPVAELLVRRKNSRASLVCASLAGPGRGCFLAGQPIERIYPYVPLSGDHPLAVAALAYRDTLCVGVDIDAVAMGNLDRLRSDLQASYGELLRCGSPRSGAQMRRRRPSRRRAAL